MAFHIKQLLNGWIVPAKEKCTEGNQFHSCKKQFISTAEQILWIFKEK